MHKFLIIALFVMNIVFSNICMAQNDSPQCNQCNVADIPKKLEVLALSRSVLCTQSSKIGDYFSARLTDNICIGQQTLIPSGSILCGKVKKINTPKRFLNRDGFILVSIQEIDTPQGQTISLIGNEVEGKIISPITKSTAVRVGQQVPIRAAAYGTSIPLSAATNLNGGIIYAIGTAASMTAGAVTGFFTPDYGLSRPQTSLKRAFEASPVGTAYGVITKGNDAQMGCGDGIIFNFNRPAIARIQRQYIAQSQQPKIITASAAK